MNYRSALLCVLVVFSCLLTQQTQVSASPGTLLREPGIFFADNTGSLAGCTNCLIRRCLVTSGNKLNGYCLTGARGGICHEAYSPTACPVGAPVKSLVQRQCGPSWFRVDNARPC